MFSCDIFMRRSGNWMSTKKVRSLGSQPMSKRCSRAVWMQDRAGSKDLKRPWSWELPKLPLTHGDDRDSGVRDGVCPSMESRREPQTAGLGSLRYLSKFLRLHTNPLQRTPEAKEFWKHQVARFPPCQDYHGRHFTGKAWVTQLSSDQQQDQGQPQRARVMPLRRREEPFDLRFMSTPLTMEETRGWLSSF